MDLGDTNVTSPTSLVGENEVVKSLFFEQWLLV